MKKTIYLILAITINIALAQGKELRGIWIATAWGGIDWPENKIIDNSNATEIASQQAEIVNILNKAVEGNLNALFFQIRGHGDAIYQSSYEPWSAALTGTRGKSPGYDPLAFIIYEAHKRGLELHAWVNPYRISNYTPNSPAVENSWIINRNSASAFLDPGNINVQNFTLNIIGEILRNYDIDGLVFDDYFYKSMPDNRYASNETHRTKKNNPHNLNVNDWRRENINQLIKSVSDSIKQLKPFVRFGVAPFGIYSTNNRIIYDDNQNNPDTILAATGINGNDSYATMYCDAAAWLKRGYIDYIAPQLYWPSLENSPTYHTAQDYTTLCKWWSALAKRYNRSLITSNDIANNKPNKRFNPPCDIENQIDINRQNNRAEGTILYNTTYYQNRKRVNPYFGSKTEGYHTYLKKNHFENKTLFPIISWRTAPHSGIVSNLEFNPKEHKLTWESNNINVRYAIYSYPNTTKKVDRLDDKYLLGVSYDTQFNTAAHIDKYEQTWSVFVLDRYGNLYQPYTLPRAIENIDIKLIDINCKQLPIYNIGNNKILVNPNTASHLTIYTNSGNIIFNRTIKSATYITLQSGVYTTILNRKASIIIVQ